MSGNSPSHSPVARSVMKSGWVLRKTNVLKRWKKSWLVLWASGRLAYYDNESAPHAEDYIDIPFSQFVILSSEQCPNVDIPEQADRKFLFGVKSGDKTWIFCGDSIDDTMAWVSALEEIVHSARPSTAVPPTNVTVYPGGSGYPYVGQPYATTGYPYYSSGPTYYYPPGQYPGRITYVVPHDGDYYRRGCYGPGTGFLAGAALGSMFMWPMMWGPMWGYGCW